MLFSDGKRVPPKCGEWRLLTQRALVDPKIYLSRILQRLLQRAPDLEIPGGRAVPQIRAHAVRQIAGSRKWLESGKGTSSTNYRGEWGGEQSRALRYNFLPKLKVRQRLKQFSRNIRLRALCKPIVVSVQTDVPVQETRTVPCRHVSRPSPRRIKVTAFARSGKIERRKSYWLTWKQNNKCEPEVAIPKTQSNRRVQDWKGRGNESWGRNLLRKHGCPWNPGRRTRLSRGWPKLHEAVQT